MEAGAIHDPFSRHGGRGRSERIGVYSLKSRCAIAELAVVSRAKPSAGEVAGQVASFFAVGTHLAAFVVRLSAGRRSC